MLINLIKELKLQYNNLYINDLIINKSLNRKSINLRIFHLANHFITFYIYFFVRDDNFSNKYTKTKPITIKIIDSINKSLGKTLCSSTIESSPFKTDSFQGHTLFKEPSINPVRTDSVIFLKCLSA